MVVEAGYKQTEVGVIPEDWECSTLEQVVSKFVNGGTPSTSIESYWKGEIPWITGADIIDQRVSEIRRHINNTAVMNSSTNVILKGNILLVSRTGVGKLAIAPFDIAISQDFTGIYPNIELVLPDYLFLFLDYNKDFLTRNIQGTSIQGITRETISTLPIFYPSTLSEQETIARPLSDIDELIRNLEGLIEKKRKIKKGAMQELLTGKKRLPGFQDKEGYKKTDIGMIPEDWDVFEIDDISDVKSGKRLPKGNKLTKKPTAQPYIRVADMIFGGVVLNDIKYVPSDVYPKISKYKIFKNDIFISVAGTLGIVGKIPVILDGANLTENANRLTNITCDRDFLLYTLMSHIIQSVIKSESTLGAQPKLALTRIRKFKVPAPKKIKEQQAISTVLSDMDTEIQTLQSRLSKYTQIKKGMMQELLTGKTRLV